MLTITLSRQQTAYYSDKLCFPFVSMASPFTGPCCEVSEVESGISTIISMAIDSCCGKQRIRGFLQNRAYHQQRVSPPYPLPEAAQRAGRSKPLSCRKLPVKQAIKKNVKMSTLGMQNENL